MTSFQLLPQYRLVGSPSYTKTGDDDDGDDVIVDVIKFSSPVISGDGDGVVSTDEYAPWWSIDGTGVVGDEDDDDESSANDDQSSPSLSTGVPPTAWYGVGKVEASTCEYPSSATSSSSSVVVVVIAFSFPSPIIVTSTFPFPSPSTSSHITLYS